MTRSALILTVILITILSSYTSASDWPAFLGANAQGVSSETDLPATWSETENLAWKTPLPGPGSSSPITLGDKVYVTCYSGYGLDKKTPGDQSNLKRHLLCIDAANGKIIWDKTVPAILPEDPYNGMLCEHGYASSTPATDGKSIYVFFGKSGVLAFDLDGKQLWQTSVGTGTDKLKWGSAASPTLYKNLVIVNAWDESKSLIALDKKTGKQIWKKDTTETGLTFSTPVLTKSKNGTELIVSLPKQTWSLDPTTGTTLWTANTNITETMIPNPVIHDGVIYIHGGGPKSSGSLAIKTGGKGDVTDTHVVWTSKEVSSTSPVIVDGNMYWTDSSGTAACAETITGKLIYSQKLPTTGKFAVYASPVTAENRIYITTRKNGTFVIAATPTYKLIAQNKFQSDKTDFNATPAISNKKIYIRSNKTLYCLKK